MEGWEIFVTVLALLFSLMFAATATMWVSWRETKDDAEYLSKELDRARGIIAMSNAEHCKCPLCGCVPDARTDDDGRFVFPGRCPRCGSPVR